VGAVLLFSGELGPHLTQCRLGWGLPLYQVASWSNQPCGHNRHRPKIGRLCPFGERGSGSPSNTMWPWSRPTCMPSFILIHPTIWPQYTNVTQTDRQTRTDSKRFTSSRPKSRYATGQKKTLHCIKKAKGNEGQAWHHQSCEWWPAIAWYWTVTTQY